MCKVKCKICGEIGYTASPNYARCLCGGRLTLIPEPEKKARYENQTNNP